MIATEFKLMPLASLHPHEDAVLHGLDSLPISYQKSLIEDSEIRYSFLYYVLFTHWPELLDEGLELEELFYNRYYWFLRLSKQYQARHGHDAGCEQQAVQMLETADVNLDLQVIDDLEKRVVAEVATNEKEIAVSFNDFSIGKVLTQFHLQLDETGDFFAGAASAAVSSLLRETLKENVPLGLAMGTEKARSEFIIAPVLSEVRRQLANAISLFSGIELNVDSDQGLRGECDFLLCQSPHQLVLEAPVVSVVEAKKENIPRGVGQCLAEMVAARIFNQQQHREVATIYGVVTTGSIWKFLRIVDSTAYIDVTEYYINDVERIVGIIVSMFTSNGIAKKA